MSQNAVKIDFIESKTAELLRRAKRTSWFKEIIEDSRKLQAKGYVQDVALAISLNYFDPKY